ncbi:hypothetical protein LTR04_002155 [Oleoguttula sp. CCFEE 6159]|nr:hypothetical protein LTR04_002155 [Oleoguttula sp. CCFEE 6159]
MAVLKQPTSIRPANNEPAWFDSYDDLFEHYVDSDPFELSDSTLERLDSSDFSNFFDLSAFSSDSDPASVSPIPDWDVRQNKSEQPWEAALRYLEQTTTMPAQQGNQTPDYSTSCSKVADFGEEVFSLVDLYSPPASTTLPVSPTPSSPSAAALRRQSKAPETGTVRRNTAGIRKPTRKSSISPSMMRPSQYRAGYHDIWMQRRDATADRFNNLQLPNYGLPVSPPPSAKVSQAETCDSFRIQNKWTADAELRVDALNDEFSPLSLCFQQQASLHTPLAQQSEVFRSPYTRQPGSHLGYVQAAYPPKGPGLQTPPLTARMRMPSWGSDEAFDPSLSASPRFQGRLSPSVAQPSTSAYHNTQHASQQLTMLTNEPSVHEAGSLDLATGGLMIQCDPSAMDDFTRNHPDPYFSASSPYYGDLKHNNAAAPEDAYYRCASTPGSTSPSPPPSSRPKRASALRVSSHRRNKTAPCTPSIGGFVNFTPSDSRKILTGVAPSGSSKTKARREKEAADKRRRLSQAVVRAVVQAGGDIRGLEEEGLLI